MSLSNSRGRVFIDALKGASLSASVDHLQVADKAALVALRAADRAALLMADLADSAVLAAQEDLVARVETLRRREPEKS